MVPNFQLSGWVKVQQWRKGALIYAHEGKNLVTELGFEQVAQILGGGAVVLPSHMGIGSDGTFPDPSQTTLVNEIAVARVVIAKSFLGRQTTYIATETAAAPLSVREIGIFDAATDGLMWARFLTGLIEFLNGDSLDIEWELTVGQIV